MKIVSIKAMPFAYTFDDTQVSRYLRGQRLSCLFVRVETDEGMTGYGEVCDSLCCNYPVATKTLIEEALEPLLLNADPVPVEALAQRMYGATRRRLGDSGIARQAISGVEIALWDLAGKIEAKPVSQLLGGSRKQIPVYASGTYLDEGPPPWHLAFYEPCLRRGIKTIKVRMGREYRRDLETLRGFRKLLGDEIQLLVDGGELYSLAEALEISQVLAGLGVVFFEEPLPQCQSEAIASLVRKSSVRIACGEHLFNLYEFQDCLVHRRADVIQPDAAICGGISEARKVTVLGEAAGVSVIPHAAAGPFSLAANLHLAAAATHIPMLEYSFPLEPMWQAASTESAFSPDALREGSLAVPEGPGLGLAFDEEAWGNLPTGPAAEKERGSMGNAELGESRTP